ncbi:hypothetical protein BACCIP111899_03029 [Bacillus rhizoplanae]|uniref:Uncharacterized protein n=2 Tax=Bacillaceae TaxID=186817 RepID=A0ABM8YDF9_9BACI|nr:hypothetical protein BACCIP111899_03029 [Bacillus rhizoplanae]
MLSIEDAKNLVAGRLRLIDDYTCYYVGNEMIFDKLVEEDGPVLNVSLEMEPMVLVSLFQLYYVVDAFKETLEYYKNNNPIDNINYNIGASIYDALEDYEPDYSFYKDSFIKRKDLENLLYDFAELIDSFYNLPC